MTVVLVEESLIGFAGLLHAPVGFVEKGEDVGVGEFDVNPQLFEERFYLEDELSPNGGLRVGLSLVVGFDAFGAHGGAEEGYLD